VMTSCPRRQRTVVPTQALTLLNSPLAHAQAAAFARRLTKECGGRPEDAPERAWRLAFGRPITDAESERAATFLRERTAARAGTAGTGPAPVPRQRVRFHRLKPRPPSPPLRGRAHGRGLSLPPPPPAPLPRFGGEGRKNGRDRLWPASPSPAATCSAARASA